MNARTRVAVVLVATAAAACSLAPGEDEPAVVEQLQTSTTVTPRALLDELFDRASVAEPPPTGARFSTFMHASHSPLGPDRAVNPRDDGERRSLFARCGVELANPCARDMNMDFVDGTRDDEVEIDRVDLPRGGVLTRFWTVVDPGAVTSREVRFYVDDDPTPLVLSFDGRANAALPFPFGDPDVPASRSVLGGVTENGIVTHAPIAFAHRLRITSKGRTASGRLYYQATYRRYDDAVPITPTPTSGAALAALREHARTLSARWSAPATYVDTSATWTGSGVVRAFSIEVPAEAREVDIDRARLVVTSDGHATPDVDVPLLDFFATSLAHDGRRAIVDHTSGFVSARNLAPIRFRGVPFVLESRWPLPFASGLRIEVRGLPGARVRAESSAGAPPSELRLHAFTARSSARTAEPRVDRVLDVAGSGVYAGTTIAVDNGTDRTWWGEGDEFVRADDELVLAGTGMEDFFGYGYSSSIRFESPLHSQPVASGRTPGVRAAPWAGFDTYDNSGLTIDHRAMVLDRIPFRSRLTFDWELLHTHWLRPFMEHEPPPGLVWNATYDVRVLHYVYVR